MLVPRLCQKASAEGSGSHKVALPRTRNGIAVFSMGSVIPESEALEFESAAHGESHTWRATKEFALLGEILGSFEWGALDVLLFDLPPGTERTVRYADFLGPPTSFLLVTIPSEVSRGVVARSVTALSRGPNRLLGYVENMSGYYCRDCNAIKPLFASSETTDLGIPCLGHYPLRSRAGTTLRSRDASDGPARHTRSPCPGRSRTAPSGPPLMKFLCVPCDSPMKLQTIAPPEGGSLSVVYSCPECGYEMAMLTNADPNAGRPVTRRADWARHGRVRGGGRREFQVPVPRDAACQGRTTRRCGTERRANPDLAGLPLPKRGSRIFPSSSAPWRGPASRDSRAREGPSKWTRIPRRGPRLLWYVIRPPAHEPAAHERDVRFPGPTSSPGTSPTAATSPASTATSTPAARRWSERRTSPIGASWAPRNASGSSTRSPRSRPNA